MDNYLNKTKTELITEIQRLEKLNKSLEIKNDDGLLEKVAIVEKSTEGKQAEINLIQINEPMTNPLENMSDGFVSLDKNWNYTFVNKKAGEMFGKKPEELIGKHIWTEFPEGIDKPFYKNYYKAVETQKQINIEEFYQPWDRWFENRIIPSKEGLVIFFQDITKQKKVQEALIKNEKRQRDIFDSMSEGFSIQDVICNDEGNPIDLRFVDANPAFEKQTGLINSETLGHTLLELFPTSEKLWIERYGKVGVTGEPISFEAMFGPLNIYYNVNAFQTAPRQFGVLFTDINERKLHEIELAKAKEKVEESEKHLKHSQKLAKLGHWKLRPETLEVEGSEELLNIFEIEPGKLTLDSFMKVIHPGDAKENKETIEAGISDGKSWDIEHRLVFKNGRTKWIRAIGEPYLDDNNKVTHIDGIVQDITEQKQAEQTLKQSEAFNRGIVDNSFDCIKILDLEGNLQFMSKGGVRLLEIKNVQDYIGKSWFDLFTNEERELAINAVEKAKSGGVGRLKSYIPTEKGKPMWWDAQVTPIADEKGKPISILAISRDITEQKIAEEALKETQNFNETLLNTSPDIIYIYDLDENRNIYSNEGIHKILGYTVEEVQEMGNEIIPSLMHKEDFKTYLNETMPRYQTAKDGEFIEHEYRMKHKSDGWYWLQSKESVFERLQNGSPKQIFGIINDITERKVAELALKESEEKFRTLIDEIPAGVYLTDTDGKCNYVNPTWCKMSGLDLEEAIGDGWKKGIHPEDQDQVFSNWTKMIESNGNWSFEYRMFNGLNTHWVNGRAKELKNDGKLIGYLGINTDITDRKQAEILLRDEKERIRTILDMLGDPIFVKDNDHHITLANQAFYTMFKTEEKDVIGFTLVEAVPEHERHHFLKVDRDVLDTGKADQREEELTIDKCTNTIITKKIRFIDEFGSKFLVGSITDITERKEAENELKKHREHLADLVKERTQNLDEKNDELERMNKLFIGRELKMVELKEKIKKLEGELLKR